MRWKRLRVVLLAAGLISAVLVVMYLIDPVRLLAHHKLRTADTVLHNVILLAHARAVASGSAPRCCWHHRQTTVTVGTPPFSTQVAVLICHQH